ncbi:hypothetical protein [Cupriavidus gilardii]|uniref:hypothetical protein n=1 Tax=Cupriavidus gilardii TaxID=82541 RepID=UPI0012E83576|nr:hypothetical protein [Cupriavidus gilardii]
MQLRLFDAIARLFLDPSAESFLAVFQLVATARHAMAIQRVRDFDVQIRSAQLALDDIAARAERTGEIALYQLERKTLRAAAPHIAAAIEAASPIALTAAQDRVMAELAVHGIAMPTHDTETLA